MDSIIRHQIMKGLQEARKLRLTPALAYDRVSSEKQSQGTSLDYQEENARRYADQNDLYIVYTFSQVESAFKEGRKNFNLMLNVAIECGIKDIIFKNTDRLSRNDTDWPKVKKLTREGKIIIHLYEYATVYHDESAPEQELFLDNTASMAAYWARKISFGVRQSTRHRVSKGVAPYAGSPTGYTYDHEKKQHIIDESKRNLIEYIFSLCDDENLSVQSIADRLNQEGHRTVKGNKWNKTSIHRIITSPFYTGHFNYKNELYKGTHPAYISLTDYEQRLERIHQPTRSKGDRDYPLRGLLLHQGRRLTGTTKTGAHNSGSYTYYINPSLKASFREKDILGKIDREIERITFSEDFAEFLKDAFRGAVEKKDRSQAKGLEIITKNMIKIEQEQDRLLQLLIEGELDKATIRRRMDTNTETMKKLETDRHKMRVNRKDFILNVSDTIDRIRDLPYHYQLADDIHKGELLREIAESITVDEDAIKISWKKPFSFLLSEEMLQHFPGEENRVPKRPVMHARRDSNP